MLVKQCHKPSPSHHILYRWYVYHSQSWMVYDNALPTLNPLTLIIPVVSNLDSMDLWWPAAVSSPWSLVFYPLVNKQFAIENAHRNNSMVELSIVFCMFTRANHMEVSWNGGTPESSIFMGFSTINENLDPSFMEPPHISFHQTCSFQLILGALGVPTLLASLDIHRLWHHRQRPAALQPAAARGTFAPQAAGTPGGRRKGEVSLENHGFPHLC